MRRRRLPAEHVINSLSAAGASLFNVRAMMREMHDLIDRLMTWFDDVQKLAPETAMQLMGMGTAVTRVLELKDRMTGRRPTKE